MTAAQKTAFKDELEEYCKLAERYEARWHYTQQRPYTGLGTAPQTFHRDDCSSYVALAFYWAAKHTGVSVRDPLNFNYSGYGNTQSAIEWLDEYAISPKNYRRADIAIYGTRSLTKHMTVCRKWGSKTTSVWSSFGREAGPNQTKLLYRDDLVAVYRHPALA